MAFRDGASGGGRFKIDPFAILLWLWVRASENRDKFIALAAGVGVSAIGWQQNRIASWALFEWALFALALSLGIYLVIKVCRAIGAWDYSQVAQARFTHYQIRRSAIIPVKSDFHRDRIKLVEFYHPHFRRMTNVTFRDCELIGPSNIAFQGTIRFMGKCRFDRCEVVIVREGVALPTPLVLENAAFTDCQFHAVTLYFTAADARAMKSLLGGFQDDLPIISDGACGDI